VELYVSSAIRLLDVVLKHRKNYLTIPLFHPNIVIIAGFHEADLKFPAIISGISNSKLFPIIISISLY
jgi:hypothetical protein